MGHQLAVFLLLFGALQGWLLSLWFLRNRRRHISNYFISFLLFVVGLQLTSKVITKVWLMHHVHWFYVLSYQLPFLAGPAIFLFVKARSERPIRKFDLLHMVPFAFTVLLMWLDNGEVYVSPYERATFQLLSLAVYGWLSFRMAGSELRRFLVACFSAETIIVITLALMVVYYGRFPDVRLLFVVLTALIYWVSYLVIARSSLFSEESPVIALNARKTPKYAHSSLRTEEADRIEAELTRLVDQKIYCDASLTIEKLSARLNTSRHHVSRVINERKKKTYAEFINDLRLDESRSRLSGGLANRYTIAAIALDSGFSSVSAFNDLFKKRFGATPSKFRDQVLKKMSA